METQKNLKKINQIKKIDNFFLENYESDEEELQEKSILLEVNQNLDESDEYVF